MLSLPHANHECVKPGFAIESYSVDKPAIFYSGWYAFKHKFAFYQVHTFFQQATWSLRLQASMKVKN